MRLPLLSRLARVTDRWKSAARCQARREAHRAWLSHSAWFAPSLEVLENRQLLSVNLSVSNPTPLQEGDSGTTNMVFVVSRSGDATAEIEVNYTTVDGTAVVGTDYTATSGTLDFAPGATTLPVSVLVIGNTIVQNNRTFTLSLSSPLQAVSFDAAQSFAAGNHAGSVAAADLNGDGQLDMIVTNSISNTVSVLLNQTTPGATTPTFASAQTFTTGAFPQGVAVGDFNGDGRADLLVADSNSNALSVLLSTTTTGATTINFSLQQTFATGSNTLPKSVAVADVNGDGRPDLLASNFNKYTVDVFLNQTTTGATTASFSALQTFSLIPSRRRISTEMACRTSSSSIDPAIRCRCS